MAASLCKDCWKASKAFQNCKWLNSPISMKEQRDLQLIRKNLSVLPDPLTGKHFITLDFPFLVDVHKTHKATVYLSPTLSTPQLLPGK